MKQLIEGLSSPHEELAFERKHLVFKTQYNSHLFPPVYEVNRRPSLTIPDQTMSVKQIMDRYAGGLGASGIKIPVYEGEDSPLEGIDLNTLDLSEKFDWINENRIRIAELQDRLKNPGKYRDQEIPFEEIKDPQDKKDQDKKDPQDKKEKTDPK